MDAEVKKRMIEKLRTLSVATGALANALQEGQDDPEDAYLVAKIRNVRRAVWKTEEDEGLMLFLGLR